MGVGIVGAGVRVIKGSEVVCAPISFIALLISKKAPVTSPAQRCLPG